jgi:hypothetical protein
MNPFDLLWSLGDIQSFADHVKSADGGDPWGFAGLGADAAGTAQSFVGKAGETPVIEAGLIAIMIMNWMCGFGDSEKGDGFGDGGSKFNDVIEKLKSASPDGTWQGSGSDAYASQNVKQQSRASTMVDADFEMNQIISCEANQLSGTRDILDHAGTVLGYAILPALLAMKIPGWGWEISMGIQLGAVGGTVPVCQAEMIQMAARALENADSVRKAIDKYNSANPDPNLRTHEVGLWGSPRSTVTDQGTDGSSGEPSPVSSQTPSSAPTNPSSPAPHIPSAPAPTAPSSPAPTSPAPFVPSTPAPTMPSTPAPTVPSRGNESPNVASPSQPSTPPATPVPSLPGSSPGNVTTSSGTPASASGGIAASGSASAPTSPANQFATKQPLPQAASGSANGERAPIRVDTQPEEDKSVPEASNRTGENDVR